MRKASGERRREELRMYQSSLSPSSGSRAGMPRPPGAAPIVSGPASPPGRIPGPVSFSHCSLAFFRTETAASYFPAWR
ncbi:MAG: hypothetical protein BWY88_01280 [Synergistetes bacterium ADurb.Bin520]|nr:MAG: hypothetical protein BWY88_01280 [Synergistetes bacterium ADurb.Bin520]